MSGLRFCAISLHLLHKFDLHFFVAQLSHIFTTFCVGNFPFVVAILIWSALSYEKFCIDKVYFYSEQSVGKSIWFEYLICIFNGRRTDKIVNVLTFITIWDSTQTKKHWLHVATVTLKLNFKNKTNCFCLVWYEWPRPSSVHFLQTMRTRALCAFRYSWQHHGPLGPNAPNVCVLFMWTKMNSMLHWFVDIPFMSGCFAVSVYYYYVHTGFIAFKIIH